jgi:prepilin-type N-terminal cleavage/methylation domain-containing protein
MRCDFVAQVSEPAVSPTSKSAERPSSCGTRVWKPATQQTWKSALRSRAFTLIEMMTVLVLIGIMTAMIIPEMKGTFEDALLRSTSRDLVSVFELASSRAISLNQFHRVRLDTETGRYVVERRVREGTQEEFVPLKDVSGCEGELDKRISIEIRRPGEESSDATGKNDLQVQTSTDTISFYPDGTADAAVIMLKDRAGFQLALKINPITARVHVLEMERQ